ncbi:MAG TPA: tRNA guanosine(34) transglycosylase Tgt [Patescibacteria group bacterium]|nr:tRNA guanosine(34) transglycosylase Tgt [Patescibacteria group bacterium]
MKPNYFKRINGDKIPLPVFFPDATRAIIRTVDSKDIESTKTPGILVNTYHLYKDLGKNVLKGHGGVRDFMSWYGGVISDSGGFQVMSIIKRNVGNGKVTDEGVTFHESSKKKVLLTPEISISFQMLLKPDMAVVLDDFTAPGASKKNAEDTVERTLSWAKRSKDEFEKICKKQGLTGNKKPYLLGVVQGGEYLDLREYCTKELVKIGFDGLGYGGWPILGDGTFNYDVSRVIREHTPAHYLLYGLGIGKPHEIVQLVDSGWHIFDCVLPTRDARHKRLYVYNADSVDKIDVHAEKFYSYYVPTKERYYNDIHPVSTACDCLLCTNYSRSYLAHLYRIEESTALRLSTIHNLRFYSLLMEKLQNQINKGAKEQ